MERDKKILKRFDFCSQTIAHLIEIRMSEKVRQIYLDVDFTEGRRGFS